MVAWLSLFHPREGRHVVIDSVLSRPCASPSRWQRSLLLIHASIIFWGTYQAIVPRGDQNTLLFNTECVSKIDARSSPCHVWTLRVYLVSMHT
jgi:hypothetical protein